MNPLDRVTPVPYKKERKPRDLAMEFDILVIEAIVMILVLSFVIP